jgi:hypothetical protein
LLRILIKGRAARDGYRANMKLCFRMNITRIETNDEMNIPCDRRISIGSPHR